MDNEEANRTSSSNPSKQNFTSKSKEVHSKHYNKDQRYQTYNRTGRNKQKFLKAKKDRPIKKTFTYFEKGQKQTRPQKVEHWPSKENFKDKNSNNYKERSDLKTRNYQPKKKYSRENFSRKQSNNSLDKSEDAPSSNCDQPLKSKKKDEDLLENPRVHIVTRDKWDQSSHRIQNNDLFYHPQANHIHYQWTNSDSCETRKECVTVMQKLLKRDLVGGSLDITYNFLVGGDADIYEGRGWRTNPLKYDPSAEPGRRTLNIGFIGQSHGSIPPPPMLTAAYHFVNYGIDSKKIFQDFDFIPLSK